MVAMHLSLVRVSGGSGLVEREQLVGLLRQVDNLAIHLPRHGQVSPTVKAKVYLLQMGYSLFFPGEDPRADHLQTDYAQLLVESSLQADE